jgi:nucleoid-associated protein YgaU
MMARFDRIDLHHPQPWDIVDDPVQIAGVGAAFEAVVGTVQLNDANGNELASARIDGVGGMGFTNFALALPVGSVPDDPRCDLMLVPDDPSGGEEGGVEPIHVPVLFGPSIKPGYTSYTSYEVVAGDTLSGIAEQFYGTQGDWPVVFAANRDIIDDPDLIFPGQVLRIPFG